MTVSGRDERFRALFAAEAEDRVRRVVDRLTDDGGALDRSLLDELFREVHTLKGGAAITGFDEVAAISHALEEVLDEARADPDRLAGVPVADLVEVLEELGELVQSSLRGADVRARADTLAGRLTAVVAGGGDRPPTSLARPAPAQLPPAPPELPTPPGRAGAAAPPLTRPADVPALREAEDEIVRLSTSRLDALLRLAGEAVATQRRLAEHLGARGNPDELDELRRLATTLAELQSEATRARMVSLARTVPRLRRAVRDVAAAGGKAVAFDVSGAETELDRGVLDLLAEPLLHLVRNAVDHGIEQPHERLAAGKAEQGTVRLTARQRGAEVVLTVSDDGRGIDERAVRQRAGDDSPDGASLLDVLSRPGFTTAQAVTHVSGRGVGLDAVRATVERVRGQLRLRSAPGAGTEIELVVPLSLSLVRCVVVDVGGERVALPGHPVRTVLPADAGAADVELAGETVGVRWLHGLLGASPTAGERAAVALVRTRDEALAGLGVDRVVAHRELLVRPLSPLLPPLPHYAGAALEVDGTLIPVIDPDESLARLPHARSAPPPASPADDGTPVVLVVDDALAIRELQRAILERAGYRVRVAADGRAALDELADGPVDLVVTDLEMPRLDGFGLVEAIRAEPAFAALPVVVLTTRSSPEDRRRALEAGANAYVVKHDFDADDLLRIVGRLAVRR